MVLVVTAEDVIDNREQMVYKSSNMLAEKELDKLPSYTLNSAKIVFPVMFIHNNDNNNNDNTCVHPSNEIKAS